jgi:hypothetical protein
MRRDRLRTTCPGRTTSLTKDTSVASTLFSDGLRYLRPTREMCRSVGGHRVPEVDDGGRCRVTTARLDS